MSKLDPQLIQSLILKNRGMIHDVNNHLNGISGYSELLQFDLLDGSTDWFASDPRTKENVVAYLGKIEESLNRVVELLAQQRHTMVLERTLPLREVNLAELIRTARDQDLPDLEVQELPESFTVSAEPTMLGLPLAVIFIKLKAATVVTAKAIETDQQRGIEFSVSPARSTDRQLVDIFGMNLFTLNLQLAASGAELVPLKESPGQLSFQILFNKA